MAKKLIIFVFIFAMALAQAALAVPTISQVIIDSTSGTAATSNTAGTDEELFAVPIGVNPSGSKVIYDWRRNGQPLTELNMPFEGGAQTKDYSASTITGYNSGATWLSNGGRDGKGAYQFDGGTYDADHIDLGATMSFSDATGASVEMWVKSNYCATDPERNYCILFETDGQFELFALTLMVYNTGQPAFFMYNGNYYAAVSNVNIFDNNWHHIIGTWSPNGLKIYVDGQLTGAGFSSYLGSYFAGQSTIGAQIYGGAYISGVTGIIDDVRVYNYELSPGQAATLYSDGNRKISPQELQSGQTWTVLATPNDGVQDGNTVTSNTVSIVAAPSNSAPTHTVPILNSTFGTNKVNENLTVYPQNVADADGDSVQNITDWRLNGNSIAVLNLPFETNTVSTAPGAIRDYSMFGNNGQLGGGTAANAPAWTTGKVGGAYNFDGVNDYISVPDSASLRPSGNYTLSAWINQDTNSLCDGTRNNFVPVGKITLGTNGYMFYEECLGNTWEFINYGLTPAHVPLNVTNQIGVWRHFVGVYNGTHLVSYVDGNRTGVQAVTGTVSHSTQPLQIGKYSTAANFFDGRVDEVALFNRSLSAQEVQQLYQDNAAGKHAGTFVSQELRRGDIWSVAVTPNDAKIDGNTLVSNSVTVRDDPPVIVSATLTPSIVGSSAQLTITKVVTDEVGVTSVSAQIKNSAGTVVGSLPLSRISGTVTNGAWQGTFTFTTQPDGTYSVTDTATDTLGQTTTVVDGSVLLDRTAPTLTIVSIVPGIAKPTDQITVTASASDATSGIASITVRDVTIGQSPVAMTLISGSGAPGQSGTWQKAIAAQLPEGSHTIEVQTTDNAANSNTQSGTFSLDATAPSAPTLIAPASGSITSDSTPVFDWSDITDASGVTYQVQLDDSFDFSSPLISVDGIMSSTYTPAPLSEGTYYWRVRGTDGAGNVGAFSAAIQFSIDQTPPTINSASVSPSMVGTTAQITITKDVTDSAGVSSVTASIKGPAPATDTIGSVALTLTSGTNNQGQWTGTFTFPAGTADGTYTVSDTVQDSVGNTQTIVDGTVLLDRTQPTLSIISISPALTKPGDMVNVIAQASDTSTGIQSVSAQDTTAGSATVQLTLTSGGTGAGQTGTFEGSITAALPEGYHTVSVTATDGVSNQNTATVNDAFRVDNTAPAAPALSTPFDGAALAEQPQFDWSDVSDSSGVTYELQIDDNQDFSSPVVNLVGLIASSYGPAQLNEGSYYWRVKTRDNAGNTGPYSLVFSFTIDTTIPQAPVIVSPQDGSALNDNTPTLQWNAVPDFSGVTYSVDVSTDLGFVNLVGTQTGLTSLSYTTNALSEGQYFWRVRAIDGSGNPGQYGIASFTIDTTAPGTASLISPAHGTKTNDKTPIFDWSDVNDPSGVTYEFTIATDSALTNVIFTTTLTDSTYSSAELPDNNYFWAVKTIDGAGNPGQQSSVSTLLIDTVPPAAPALLTPANGFLTNNPAITFDWSDATDQAPSSGVLYDLIIDDDVNFVTPVQVSGLSLSTYSGTPLADGKYYWKVKSKDEAGNDPYSETYEFTIDTTAPEVTDATITPSIVGTTAQITITKTVTDAIGVASVSANIKSGSTIIGTTALTLSSGTAQNGVWSGTFVFPIGVADGTYTVYDTVTDTAGNSQTVPDGTVLLDRTQPAVSVVSITPGLVKPGDTVTVTASASDSSTGIQSVSAQDTTAGTPVTMALTSGSKDAGQTGTFEGTFNAAMPEGAHTVQVTATDGAGNLNTATATGAFSLDATAPSTPLLVNPAHNSLLATGTINLDWNDAADANAITYELQLSADSTFTQIISTVNNLVDSSYTVAGLADNTYYWRVRATDAVGNIGEYSTSFSFIVDSTPPGIPVLMSPANNAKTNDNTPAFDWSDVTDLQVSYEIQIDDASDFSSPVVNPVSASTFTPAASLADGLYFWRVRAKDGAGNYGEYSAANNLLIDTVPPAAPVLASPANGALISTSNVVFDWNDVADAEPSSGVIYDIIIDNNADFNTPEAQASDLSVSMFSASLPDGTYNWKVKSKDNAGNDPYSAVFTFTLDSTAPVILNADITPSIVGQTAQVSITKTVTDAFGVVQVDAAIKNSVGAAMGSIELALTSGTAQSGTWQGTYTFTSEPDGTYTIEDSASDAAGNAQTQVDGSVLLDRSAPTVVVATISPSLVKVGDSVTVEAAASDAVSGIATVTASDTVLAESPVAMTLVSGSQAAGQTSNWRRIMTAQTVSEGELEDHTINVAATDNAGNTNLGSTVFTIDVLAPSQPILATPADQSFLIDNLLTFSWTASQDASTLVYTIQLARDADFTNVIVEAQSVDPTFTHSSAVSDGRYYWRVRGIDAAGNIGAFSEVFTFFIDTVVPGTPALSSPADGSSSSSVTQTFDWNDVDDGAASSGVLYDFEIDDNIDFSSPIVQETTDASTFTPTYSFLDGTYYWRVKSKDVAGNDPMSMISTLRIDSNRPVILGASMSNDIVGSDAQFSLTATAMDNVGVTGFVADVKGPSPSSSSVGTFNLALANGNSQEGGWSGTFNFPSLALAPDGTYDIVITASDAAGNEMSHSIGTVTLDRTGSTVAIMSITTSLIPLNGRTEIVVSASDATTGFTGTDSLSAIDRTSNSEAAFTSFSGSLAPGQTGKWIFTQDAAAPDGTHYEEITSVDVAGNTNMLTGSFTVDATSPQVTFTAMPPTNIPLLGAQGITFTVTASDARGIKRIDILLDGTVGASCTQSPCTITVPSSQIAVGPHTFTARAIDIPGNEAYESATPRSFTVQAKRAWVAYGPYNAHWDKVAGDDNKNSYVVGNTYHSNGYSYLFVDARRFDANGVSLSSYAPYGYVSNGLMDVAVQPDSATGSMNVYLGATTETRWPNPLVRYGTLSQVKCEPTGSPPYYGSCRVLQTMYPGSTRGDSYVYSVATDSTGVYVTGNEQVYTCNGWRCWYIIQGYIKKLTFDLQTIWKVSAIPYSFVASNGQHVFTVSGYASKVYLTKYDAALGTQLNQVPFLPSGHAASYPAFGLAAESDAVYIGGQTGLIGGTAVGFVAKYNTNLALQWTKLLDTAVRDVSSGPLGVYAAGQGGMIWKLDKQGNLVWSDNTIGSADGIAGGTAWVVGEVNKYAYMQKFDEYDPSGRTDYTPPGAVNLLSPKYQGTVGLPNGMVNTNQVVFDWTDAIDPAPSSGVTDYTIQVARDDMFRNIVLSQSNIADSTYTATGIADGFYYWRILAADREGNVGMWSQWAYFYKDTVAPSAPYITSPPANTVITDRQPYIYWFKSTDPAPATQVAEYTVTIDNNADFSSPEYVISRNPIYSWARPDTPLAEGAQYVRVTARDYAGNTRDSQSGYKFTVDVSPPVITGATLTPSIIGTTAQVTITKDVQDTSGVASVVAEIKGPSPSTSVVGNVILSRTSGTAQSGTWSGTFTFPAGAADGIFTVSDTVTDTLGNSQTVTDGTVVLDRTAPSVSIISISPGLAKPGDQITVNAQASDSTTGIASMNARDTTANTATVPLALVSGGTSAGQTGTFQGSFAAVLPEGPHTVTVTATDNAANTQTATANNAFSVDATAPGTPTAIAPANGASTTDTTPMLDWTDAADANAVTYELQLDNDADFSSPLVNAAGLLSSNYAITTALTEGTYHWRVRATDAAGNTGNYGTFSFNVDTSAPNVISAVLSPSIVGTTAQVTITKQIEDSTGVSSVTADVRTSLGSSIGSASLSLTTGTTQSGTWRGTFSFTASAADGTYTIYDVVVDALGNSQTVVDGTVVLDRTAPSVSIISISPGLVKPGDLVVVNAQASDSTTGIAGITAQDTTAGIAIPLALISGGTAPGETGNFQGSATAALPEGFHTVTVSATDNAANVQTATAANAFSVDAIAPSTPTQITPANGAIITDNTPTLDWSSATDTNAVTYEVQIDNTADFSSPESVSGLINTEHTSTPLGDGTYYWRVRATDAAGNTGEWTPAFRYTIDTQSPSISDTTVTPAIVGGTAQITITKTVSDAVAIASVTAEVKGPVPSTTSIGTITLSRTSGTAQNGVYSGTFTFPNTPDGTYEVYDAVTDTAGNAVTQLDRTVLLDRTQPSISIITIEPAHVGLAQPVTVTAAASDSTSGIQSVTAQDLTSGGIPIALSLISGGTGAGQTGNFEGTITSAAPEGAHDVRVTSMDRAGNQNSATAIAAFTVDATPPDAPTLISLVDGSKTNDATPTFTWTSVSGAINYQYQLSRGTGFQPSELVTDLTTTDTSFTVSAALLDGYYFWRVRAIDASGNTGAYSTVFNFLIDTQQPEAPVLVSPGHDEFVNSNQPRFDWTDAADPEPSSGVIYDFILADTPDMNNPRFVASDLAASEFTPTTGFADGTYYWTAKSKDQAGNDPFLSVYTVNIDTVAPVIQFSADSAITPQIVGTTARVHATVYISEHNIDKTTVHVTAGGYSAPLVQTAGTPEFGTWEGNLDFPADALEGEYTVKAFAVDLAGNAPEGIPIGKATLDKSAPDFIGIVTVSPAVTKPGGTIAVSASAKDTYSGVSMMVARDVRTETTGVVMMPEDNTLKGLVTTRQRTFSAQKVSAEEPEIHPVEVRAYDNADPKNVRVATGAFEIDSVAPQLTQIDVTPSAISPGTSPGANDDAFIGFVTDEPGYFSIQINDNNGAVVYADIFKWMALGANTFIWDGTTTMGQIVPDGFYYVYITTHDEAGNDLRFGPFQIEVDTVPPAPATILQPGEGQSYNVGKDGIKVGASPDTKEVEVKVSTGGVLIWEDMIDNIPGVGIYPPVPIPDGGINIEVKPKDDAGNTGAATGVGYNQDGTAPTLGTITAAGVPLPTTVQPGVSVNYKVQVIGSLITDNPYTCTSSADGYPPTPARVAVDEFTQETYADHDYTFDVGEHTVTFVCTDVAGNFAEKSGQVNAMTITPPAAFLLPQDFRVSNTAPVTALVTGITSPPDCTYTAFGQSSPMQAEEVILGVYKVSTTITPTQQESGTAVISCSGAGGVASAQSSVTAAVFAASAIVAATSVDAIEGAIKPMTMTINLADPNYKLNYQASLAGLDSSGTSVSHPAYRNTYAICSYVNGQSNCITTSAWLQMLYLKDAPGIELLQPVITASDGQTIRGPAMVVETNRYVDTDGDGVYDLIDVSTGAVNPAPGTIHGWGQPSELSYAGPTTADMVAGSGMITPGSLIYTNNDPANDIVEFNSDKWKITFKQGQTARVAGNVNYDGKNWLTAFTTLIGGNDYYILREKTVEGFNFWTGAPMTYVISKKAWQDQTYMIENANSPIRASEGNNMTMPIEVTASGNLIVSLELAPNQTIDITTDSFGKLVITNMGPDDMNVTMNGNVYNLPAGQTLTDQCASAGNVANTGCPMAVQNIAELHLIDQAKTGVCNGAGACKKPLQGTTVKVFDRNKLNGMSLVVDGSTVTLTKDPAGSLYDDVYEKANLAGAGVCTTDALGKCFAGLDTTGDYLAIVKYTDAQTGKTVYTGKPLGSADFVNGIATKDFQVIKTFRKDGAIQFSGGSKTVVTGSYLEVVYPDEAVWDIGVSKYLYPFIFASDSDWQVDVCAQVPQGYNITGVYDETGNLLATNQCVQTFVQGQTKVVAFEVIDVASPPEWAFGAKLKLKHKGKQSQLDLSVPTKVKGKTGKKEPKGNAMTGGVVVSPVKSKWKLPSWFFNGK